MRSLVIRFLSTIQLTRLTNAFAGVANLWFIVLWTRTAVSEHNEVPWIDWPLWTLLAVTAVLGVGMSTYAGALNDVFDIKRDRVFAPRRPIPSGRISREGVVLIGYASLIISMVAAVLLGTNTLLMCLLCAAAILVYNTTSRHVPSLGLLNVGIIYGSHMLMPNLGFRFIWPILLVMAHTIIVHAGVYRLEEKRPKLTWLTAIGVTLGFAVLVLIMFWQTGYRGIEWVENSYIWFGFAWPLAAVIIFTVSIFNKTRFAAGKKHAAEKLERYGSLWMGIYAICWFLGGGQFIEAGILGLLVGTGILWMLFVRDLGVWIEQPVGYRW